MPDVTRDDDPAKLGSKYIDALPRSAKFKAARQKIVQWFLRNCRDPRQDLSYEPGFVGRYSTDETVERLFADRVSEQIRRAAIADIEAQSNGCKYWETGAIPETSIDKGGELDNLQDHQPSENYKSQLLRQEMLKEIASLEHAINQLSVLNSQIGHNHPPEPIEPLEFGKKEDETISRAIATLRSIEPETSINEVLKAARQLKAIGERLKNYATKQADNFVSAAIKSAGSETGKWVIRLPIIALIGEGLISVFQATANWLASIGVMF